MTGSVGADEDDFLEAHGADLRFRRIPSLQREINARRDAESLARVAHYIRGFKPDVIHTHTAKAGVIGRTAAIVSRSKAVRVHTFHGHLLHGYFSDRETKGIIEVERRLARHSHRLIAVGDQVKQDLLMEGIGWEYQYSVVPPGLSLDPLPDPHETRQALSIPPNAHVISFIGRLAPIKRIDRLVEAIRLVASQSPNTVFVIAGDGSEMPLLVSARDTDGLPIVLLGWQARVEPILAISDLMVLTSDNEGTPVSLIQAGLAGVPVVASDVGSVSDVVVNGSSGSLVDPDAAALSKEILTLLADEERRFSMATFSLQHYPTKYGAQVLVDSHLAIYDELLVDQTRFRRHRSW